MKGAFGYVRQCEASRPGREGDYEAWSGSFILPLSAFGGMEIYCPDGKTSVGFNGRDISKPIPWNCSACGHKFGLESNGVRVAVANFRKFCEQMEALGWNTHFRFTEMCEEKEHKRQALGQPIVEKFRRFPKGFVKPENPARFAANWSELRPTRCNSNLFYHLGNELNFG